MRISRRTLLGAAGGTGLIAASGGLAAAAPAARRIPLPRGIRPEGIASGPGTAYYAGSLADGRIVTGDLQAATVRTLWPGYFQVVQDREVTDEVLCGPYRLMASEATAWQRGELTFYPGESAETVTPALALDEDGRPEFDQGEANPNATPTRPDGEAADLPEQVEEPEAPLARPGQQIDGVAAEAASTSVRVITPAADDLFQVGVTTERLGGAEDRLAPPDGGSFVLVDTSGYPSTEDTAYVISAGGTDYPFTPASGPTALAIPGDGRDARLGVTYDALTQWFSVATGERQGSAAAGYYDGLTEEASAACPEEKPEERVAGFNREFSCRVRVARTAYLAEPSEPGARKPTGTANTTRAGTRPTTRSPPWTAGRTPTSRCAWTP